MVSFHTSRSNIIREFTHSFSFMPRTQCTVALENTERINCKLIKRFHQSDSMNSGESHSITSHRSTIINQVKQMKTALMFLGGNKKWCTFVLWPVFLFILLLLSTCVSVVPVFHYFVIWKLEKYCKGKKWGAYWKKLFGLSLWCCLLLCPVLYYFTN